MSIVACEYARLFYHVFKANSSPSSSKKFIKKYKRRWVVLKMEFSPVDCRLEHYDKEASWQNKKEGQVENLVEMEDVRVIADNEKDHVLELVFLHRSLFLSFDSTTKLNTWKQKLGCLLVRYTVQLMGCPEQPSRIGLYILDLQPNRIDVYDVQTSSLVWSWEMGHLRRFNFHANVPDVEVEAGTRSSTGEGHFFFTGVHMRRLFNALKERIAKPPASQPIPIPTGAQPPSLPPPLPPRRERSKTTARKYSSPSEPGKILSNSLRECDTLLVHTPSLSSFTHSPRMTAFGLDHASPITSFNSSTLSSSKTEASELELASSTTTMNLSSLSHALPVMSGHTPSEEQERSIYQHMEYPSDDDESDTSNESIYIQMSAAKAMASEMFSSSESQNEFDVIENWTCSECPLEDNPSYMSVENIMNS